jgi:AcrR family transcriptional regulator
MGAAVATFGERGYEATRVADVLAVAGVSRQTFYKHFANKHDCFLATLHNSLRLAGFVMLQGFQAAEGSWHDRLAAMMDLLTQLVVAQPAGFRMALIEVHAAGPDALDLLEQMSDAVERSVMEILRDVPEQSGLPRAAVRGVLGGVRTIIAHRLRQGREDELPQLAGELLQWALSYETPAMPLPVLSGLEVDPALELSADVSPRRRIIRAVTDIVAEYGYTDLKVADIAARAGISLTTFYTLFAGKEEAFLATLCDAKEKVLAATLPAYFSTDDWPRAVNAASRTFSGFLATDPTAAKLGGVEVWASGGEVLELRASWLATFATLLDEGFHRYPDTPVLAREAITASVDALLFDQVRRTGPRGLYEVAPVGVFLVLAPFIGSNAAAEIANEEPAHVADRT